MIFSFEKSDDREGDLVRLFALVNEIRNLRSTNEKFEKEIDEMSVKFNRYKIQSEETLNSFNLFKIISEGFKTLDKATTFPFGCFFLQLILIVFSLSIK